eukprot:XP_019924584.1 PREDICTED: uncharacterized protein LOC105332523 [Crassostrea gigas]
MFRFPSSSGLSTKWEKLCRRKDRAVVLQSDRICSCHFVDGDKNNGPTIFPWSCGKLFDFPDPTKINRTERKENQKMAVSSTSTSALSAMHCASSMDSTSAHINLDHSYQTSYHHLKEENQNLRREVEELRIQIRMMSMKRAFRIGDIIGDERKVHFRYH